ncbi:MAG: lipoate--protein ligase family protein [Cyanobacteria bacterium REEB459]|nr:lipoate--protein ligase family protein [Cyanobacteria bacterium REEB459]
MSPPVWRLIPYLDGPGSLHMALDAWLLTQHQHYGHPPSLRFYSWKPAAISLGLSQHHSYPAHWQQLTWQDQPLELVPRPSGGRGVLHQGDLTYALVTSAAGSRRQVYAHLCQFLIEGWRRLGVELRFGDPNPNYRKSANCFSQATAADLVTPAGHKLIGSAQLKQGGAVLQHGSMQINPDPYLFEQVFQTPPPPPLPQSLPALPTLIEVLTAAAAHCLGVELRLQPLSTQEWQQVINSQKAGLTLDPVRPIQASK